jgi:predicted metalloenzyme YecM
MKSLSTAIDEGHHPLKVNMADLQEVQRKINQNTGGALGQNLPNGNVIQMMRRILEEGKMRLIMSMDQTKQKMPMRKKKFL